MKKRNWVLEIILCSIVCFLAFGGYMAQAKDNGAFELEDLEGDRSHLAAFPLEGHGGDDTTSFTLSILNGELEAECYTCGVEELETLLEAEDYGLSRWESYFKGTPSAFRTSEQTVIVAAADANVVREAVSSKHLFEYEDGVAGMAGITMTMDAADVFCEIDHWRYLERSGSGWKGEWIGARYDTGLTLRDKPYFYTSDAEGFTRDSYNDRLTGWNEDSLETYVVEMGDYFYAVTAPDERCEGQTAVFRLTLDDYEEVGGELFTENNWLKEVEERVYDRRTLGEAIPVIPVPDPAESRIVGLEAIEERELLLLYRVAGNIFFADIYDTQGNLLGGADTELIDESESYKSDGYEYEAFHIARSADSQVISWEEGTSVEIKVSGELEAVENQDQYGGVHMITGKLLLWIDGAGNVETVPYEEKGYQAVVQGDRVLYLHTESAEESEKIETILGYGTQAAHYLEICDKTSGKTLYRGRLKTDFWQDDLKFLADFDTAPKAGYIRDGSTIAVGDHSMNRYGEIYIAGEWGDGR